MNKNMFQETFSVLRASDGAVTEVLKMTSNKEKRNGWRIPWPAFAAAMLAVVMIIGLVPHINATPEEEREVYENAAEMLAVQYADSDQDLLKEFVEPYVYPVSGSVTLDGFTLTVEAALYDPASNRGMLYYSITIDQAESLDAYLENINKVYDANEEGIYDFGPNYPKPIGGIVEGRVDRANSTDEIVYFLSGFAADEENVRNGKTIGLIRPGESRTELIHIPLEPYVDMRAVSLDGGNISMSAIGLAINTEPYKITEGNLAGSFQIDKFVIHFADGTEYLIAQGTYDEYGYIVTYEDNYCAYMGYETDGKDYLTIAFDEIINIKQVVSVELNGVVYPVD